MRAVGIGAALGRSIELDASSCIASCCLSFALTANTTTSTTNIHPTTNNIRNNILINDGIHQLLPVFSACVSPGIGLKSSVLQFSVAIL
jgi:hypothetical protein